MNNGSGAPRLPASGAPPTSPVSIARLLNVVCRSVHLVAVSIVLGATVWGVGNERLGLAILSALVSGLALLALEAGNGDRWLTEGRALAVAIKLALLAMLPWVPSHRAALLVIVMLVASVGSHMPSGLRHACVVARRRAAPRDERARVARADVPPASAWAARGEGS